MLGAAPAGHAADGKPAAQAAPLPSSPGGQASPPVGAAALPAVQKPALQVLQERWYARPLGVAAAVPLERDITAHAQAHGGVEAWVWLAEARYWLGLQMEDAGAPDDARQGMFERGLEASQIAQRKAPKHAGGWFWDAVNTAKVSEIRGIARSVSQLPHLKAMRDRVDRLDPSFFWGGAGRLRAAVIIRTPSLLVRMQGSSLSEAESALNAAQRHGPHFVGNQRFRAELRLKQDRDGEAERLLRGALTMPDGPEPALRAWNEHERVLCRRLLVRMGKKP